MSVYGKYRNYSQLGRKGLDIENIIDVRGNHEKIVDMDTWNKAQKILHDSCCNNKIMRPLIGVLRCPQCGGEVRTSYTKNNNKLIRYYSCKKGVLGGCHANSINAEIVEY
ncbi:hypothetical protein FD06_GL000338 [Apilactobacillus ozensis DSM 23829 = JCM 17196]|uniref:Recombinase zinc beta ribbon domain-containing protein n=2 Tax=Apilactobacillus ozensis TaxID=866801 RepID=A0A0R2AL92_9LACO|nr:hypothetical protein FD06_GL000338 [Apilactobacillus ozensis DSM 23829 = JCM 17196]